MKTSLYTFWIIFLGICYSSKFKVGAWGGRVFNEQKNSGQIISVVNMIA